MAILVRGEVYEHVARNLRFDGGALTLVDLAPSTICLTAAPVSALGYLPTGAFLDLWTEPAGAPARDSRHVRGTLSLLDPDAEVVEGLVPALSGACVVFVEWEAADTASGGPARPVDQAASSAASR